MLGVLDLDLGPWQIFYRFLDRKRWQKLLDFLRQLRRRLTGKIYVINFSPRKKAEVSGWCDANDVELGFTPSTASRLELD